MEEVKDNRIQDETLEQINGGNDAQYAEILCLYNAGIVSGMDETGTLGGSGEITRAQYVTLLSRLIRPEQRSSDPLKLPSGMSVFVVPVLPGALPFGAMSPCGLPHSLQRALDSSHTQLNNRE